MGAQLVLTCVLWQAVSGVRPSAGCGESEQARRQWLRGALEHHSLHVEGPRPLVAERHYMSYLPESVAPSTPVPLVLFFHGQYGSPANAVATTKYDTVGEAHGFSTVYFHGIGAPDGDCGTGWNVGPSAFNRTTCTKYTRSVACECSCCYKSCERLGYCSHDNAGSNCGWATCFDDVAFVQTALADITAQVCIDLDSVYATGASNGGMFVHWLVAEATRRTSFNPRLAGIVPIYGLPLAGAMDVPPALADVPIMQVHDRSDVTIPRDGSESTTGWLYVPLPELLRKWATVHGCDTSAMVPLSTPFDGGPRNVVCVEHKCHGTAANGTVATPAATAPRVVRCLYNGRHGSWLGHMEELMWWFLTQSRQGDAENMTLPRTPLAPRFAIE